MLNDGDFMTENVLYNYYCSLLPKVPDWLKKYLDVPCLNRLKHVGYFCGMDYASKDIYDFNEKITRFDHSLSTALITLKFTDKREAVLAALFHDVATPCFSHVIDYMNKDYLNQESTEEYTDKIILNDKELLKLLKEDGINPEDIINFKKYSLVDNDRPRLCADRFDGIILTSIGWTKNISSSDISELANDLKILVNEDGFEEMGFSNYNIANKALYFSEEVDKLCHSNEDNYMMNLLANITKEAIDNNLIIYDDLYYLTEDDIWNILNTSDNVNLINNIYLFKNIIKSDVPLTDLGDIKIRDLNPLVNGIRLKDMI